MSERDVGRVGDEKRAGERAGRWIGVSFVLSTIASIGLMVVYIAGGQVQLEGILIAIALGGLGVGLVVWGKDLLPGGDDVQQRKPHGSPESERDALADEFEEGAEDIGRRTVLRRMGAAAAGALGLAALFPIRSFGSAPGSDLERTNWAQGVRLVTADGEPVSIDDLDTGGFLTVFPADDVGSADAQAVLVRVDPNELDLSEERLGWTQDGYVAYSKICTHAGCPVGLYEQQTKELFCPCHQSIFDVLRGAVPTGGPATRALPQLPLSVDADGNLVAAGDFPEPVGPTFWTTFK